MLVVSLCFSLRSFWGGKNFVFDIKLFDIRLLVDIFFKDFILVCYL